MNKARGIAIYGKGGIGKSTVVSNLAAAYSPDERVMVIGCDPKADTTRTLVGRRIPTILDTMRKNKNASGEDVLFSGYGNVICVESGGPEPGVGCAGRGVIVAMSLLERIGVFEDNLGIIIYDVLGDVVCGGFAVPLREEYAEEVYIVTSGEYMALYAANNISKGIKKLKGRLGGIICNCRGIDREEEMVREFAQRIGTQVVGVIPRSELVQKSEINAQTVLEKFPESEQAQTYRQLASSIWCNQKFVVPEPMDVEEFEKFFRQFH
ncbi:MAG: Ni-sirohydrochlorin a,c-diamide reductive cyclase ATP-dependent reductase subunit [Methanobacteriaceae archaeon]